MIAEKIVFHPRKEQIEDTITSVSYTHLTLPTN